MNQWGSIGTILLCITLFAACRDTTTVHTERTPRTAETLVTNDSVPHQIMVGPDTLHYSIQLAYKLEEKAKDYTQNDITKIVFTYPQVDSFSATVIMDSVNTLVQDLLLQDMMGEVRYENLEERMTQFLQEYKEHKQEMIEFQLPSSNWVFEMKIDVLLNRPSLVSLRINKLEFTGGAHANSWTNYLTVDLTTGKVVDLKELFIDDFESQLLTISEAAFKRTVNLDADTNLVETHYEFSTGEFMLPPNFSVGTDGLHFYYNPYDLGPFALGAISFEIPYQEILSIIDTSILPLEPIEG